MGQKPPHYANLPRNTTINDAPKPPPRAAEALSGRPTIVIDPGHGVMNGKLDVSGAKGLGGVRESDLNLTFARALQGKLKERGYNVVMTRDEATLLGKADYNSSNRPRSAVGWRAQVDPKADLFLSIHHDAPEDDKTKATIKKSLPPTIYSYDGAGHSGTLARKIAEGMNGDAKQNDLAALKPWLHQPTQSRDRPAILAEIGNMNNAGDLKRTTDPRQLDALATKMANAVDAFMKTPEAKAGFPISPEETQRRANGRADDLKNGRLPDKNGQVAKTAVEPPVSLGPAPAQKSAPPPANEAAKEGWIAWGIRKIGAKLGY